MTGALQKRIGYTFRDGGLLTLALTHPSVLNQKNYQRLEFLGDAVLGAVVARILYDLYPEEREGDLARRLAALIRGETLARVARGLLLGEVLNIGLSEKQSGGHENDSNLEDALEALIGAIYLDGGFEAAEDFIVPRWTELARQVHTPPKDAKTSLQEWAQARSLPIPAYRLLETTGPAHAPQFTVEASVQGHPAMSAQAASKRAAATLLLHHLNALP